MTVPAPDNLGIAVIATGGAEEPELAEPVRALRQAGTRTELPSIKPGQIQPVRHDLPPTQVPSGPARGRTVTSYQTIQDDLRNAGTTWADREMVVHGNLVTSRQPATSLPSLARCSTFSLRLEERWKLSLR
jgi:protease I